MTTIIRSGEIVDASNHIFGSRIFRVSKSHKVVLDGTIIDLIGKRLMFIGLSSKVPEFVEVIGPEGAHEFVVASVSFPISLASAKACIPGFSRFITGYNPKEDNVYFDITRDSRDTTAKTLSPSVDAYAFRDLNKSIADYMFRNNCGDSFGIGFSAEIETKRNLIARVYGAGDRGRDKGLSEASILPKWPLLGFKLENGNKDNILAVFEAPHSFGRSTVLQPYVSIQDKSASELYFGEKRAIEFFNGVLNRLLDDERAPVAPQSEEEIIAAESWGEFA